jgi:hypothetical protein
VDKENNNSYVIKNLKSELDKIKITQPGVDPYELKYLIDNYVRPHGYLPSDSVVVSVNKEAIRKSGMALPYGDSIPDKMVISFKGKKHFDKSEMMIYEMLARSNWERPIYMSVTLGESNMGHLIDFLSLEGLAYRVTPFKTGMRIDVDKMYDNMMNRFKYGNVNHPGIYLDETVTRMCLTHRHMFSILASRLIENGDQERALKVLQKCKEMLPGENIPYETSDIEIVKLWVSVGQTAEAERVAREIAREASQYVEWAGSLSENLLKMKGQRFVRDCYRRTLVLNELSKIVNNETFQKDIEAALQKAGTSTAIKVISEQYAADALRNYNYLKALSEQGIRTQEDYESYLMAYQNLLDIQEILENCHSSRAGEVENMIQQIYQQAQAETGEEASTSEDAEMQNALNHPAVADSL